MKKNKFLLLVLLVTFCKSPVYRLETPKQPSDEKKYGIVAYGIYVLYPPGTFDPGDKFYNVPTDQNQIVKVDSNSRISGKIDQPSPTKVLIGKDQDRDLYETNATDIHGYIARVIPASGDSYATSKIGFTFCYLTTVYVNNTPTTQRKCNSTDIFVDPLETAKIIPIKAIPGDINFLGLFQAKLVDTTDDDPYALPKTLAELVGFSKRKKIVISKDNGYLLKSNNQEIINTYYSNERSKQNLEEFTFFDEFSKSQKEGFWKTISDKKLAKIK